MNKQNSAKHNRGVILTALTLFFVQFKVLYSLENRWWADIAYPFLLFCATATIYFADHAWDAQRIRNNTTSGLVRFDENLIFLFLSLLTGLSLYVVNIDDIDLSLIWLPISLVVLYAIVLLGKIRVRFLKEIIIATTVAVAVFYPAIVAYGFKEFVVSAVAMKSMILLFFLCLQNVVVMGFFEKTKDELLGNFTFFTYMSPDKASKRLWLCLVVLLLLILFLQLFFRPIFQFAWIAAIAYLIMPQLGRYSIIQRNYRWLIDLLLLFCAI